jgi:hypothetical protein
MPGMKDLVSELEDSAPLLREIARMSLSGNSWYTRLSEESQAHLAYLGRHLLGLIIKYITEPSRRGETVQLARDVGQDFGETLVELGLSLTDSVDAFIEHRVFIMNVAIRLMKKGEAFTPRVVEAIPLVAYVMDEALVSLVAAYQQKQGALQGDSGGGIS